MARRGKSPTPAAAARIADSLRSYGARLACADLCREWGTPPEGPPFPSRLLSNHKTLYENHSFSVCPLALLGATISVSLSRAPSGSPPSLERPGFSIRIGPVLCRRVVLMYRIATSGRT